jgi:hypothetical protein
MHGLVKKSKLAQLAYKEGKESPHVSLVAHLISQTILDVAPIWTLIIEEEISKLKLSPV